MSIKPSSPPGGGIITRAGKPDQHGCEGKGNTGVGQKNIRTWAVLGLTCEINETHCTPMKNYKRKEKTILRANISDGFAAIAVLIVKTSNMVPDAVE